MRVMYFVQYFRPEKASGLNLVDDLLEGFAGQGWDVDVYTPTPTRGITSEERKKYLHRKAQKLFDGKVTVHRMALYREGKGIIPRAFRYVLFSLECLWKGLTKPADVVFTGSGPPTQGLVGSLIKKLTKKKFVYNLQDAFPDSLITSGMAEEKSVFVRIGRWMERFVYKNAGAIITISDDMRNSVIQRVALRNKVHVIRNWIDTRELRCVNREDNRLFDELHLSREKFYVVYAGNIGYVQGIDCVVEAARMLRSNEKIHFLIFGNGSEESRIRQLIEHYQLTNISMNPLLGAERVSEVYSMGNVSLVTCKPGTGGSGMPSKTWTIMATGTPVLGYFDKPSELAGILDSTKTGWCVESGKIDELCKMITALQCDQDQCAEYGRNARAYADANLSKPKAVKRYIEIVEATVAAGK